MLSGVVRLTDRQFISCHGGFRKIAVLIHEGTCVHRHVDFVVVAAVVEGDFLIAPVAPLPGCPLVGVGVVTGLLVHLVCLVCQFLVVRTLETTRSQLPSF